MLTEKQNINCESVQHVVDFPLLKIVVLLASCKHEPQHFLLTANQNYSKTGVTDTVPSFPHIILQKVLIFNRYAFM
jgi:hypothetical protein